MSFRDLICTSKALDPTLRFSCFFFSFRVEEFHSGTETNTVLYIPVGPDCPNNRAYIEKAKKCFLDGEFPPDFKMPTKQDERNFQDRATLDDLNEDAKVMMGFE